MVCRCPGGWKNPALVSLAGYPHMSEASYVMEMPVTLVVGFDSPYIATGVPETPVVNCNTICSGLLPYATWIAVGVAATMVKSRTSEMAMGT